MFFRHPYGDFKKIMSELNYTEKLENKIEELESKIEDLQTEIDSRGDNIEAVEEDNQELREKIEDLEDKLSESYSLDKIEAELNRLDTYWKDRFHEAELITLHSVKEKIINIFLYG